MISSMITRILLAVAVAAAALALTGCTPPPRPAPTGSYVLDNVMSECDEHGNRVYRVYSRSQGIAVVGQDPTCAGPAA